MLQRHLVPNFCLVLMSCQIFKLYLSVVRDLDGYTYFRENEGRLLAGGFEPVAKPVFEEGNIPGEILIFVFFLLFVKF